jgi:hypothetical protein
MTSDLDIYRTASVLTREHGEDAALEAAQRANAKSEKGNIPMSGLGQERTFGDTIRKVCCWG